MFKFLPFLFLLIFTSCSISIKERVTVENNAPKYSDHTIREIMGHMEILDTDVEYPMMYDILTRSEKPYIGRDYVGYRECFMNNLVVEQKKYSVNEKIGKKFFLLDWSLKDEVSFTGLYQEIDNIPSITPDDATGSCNTVGYRIFNDGAFSGQKVTLSYWSSQKELSHLLLKSNKFTQESLSGILLHDNPCEFHTWGPDIGHILYFKRVQGNNYLFIKTGDGGGSGDFQYTIYYNTDKKSNLYGLIGTFPAYSGFTPIPQVMRDKEGNVIGMKHRKIMEEFKNRPFKYITIFENNRSMLLYEIGDLLRELTPEITYD